MKIENTQVYGLENSIRVSKFAKAVDPSTCTDQLTPGISKLGSCERGSGHDCFLKGIIVQCDLTLSEKAWPQVQRYHWFEIVSSQSTMHKLMEMSVALQCNEYVDPRCARVLEEKIAAYKEDPSDENFYRAIYNIPSGYELTAGISTNYQQLKTVLAQREFHRLPEWRKLICPWIHSLPRFDELVLGKGK